MRQEDHICWVAYNALGYLGIWPHDMFIEDRWYIFLVPADEDCGSKLWVFGIVESF